MCGINAVGAQGSGCMFTLCHAPLKMAVLLHKTEKVWDSFSETVFLIDVQMILVSSKPLFPPSRPRVRTYVRHTSAFHPINSSRGPNSISP